MDQRDAILLKLGANPELAHRVLFEHRHPQEGPPFHKAMIADWHGPHPRVLDMVFRGGAKSTIAEEAVIVKALFRRFRNCIILGASEDKAKERLKAIKHEIETNDLIHDLFGSLVGETWAETKIVLANGIIVQAFGRGQALRGSKYLDHRPDLLLADDIEDEESVATPEARRKMLKWWTATVLPSMDPQHVVRMTATPLDAEALAVTLSKQDGWVVHEHPILKVNPDTGAEESVWPERFPTDKLLQMRSDYTAMGAATEFEREYMVKPVADSDRIFLKEHFVVEPQVRKPWGAVYGFYDPARTVNKNSAHTGVAYWSWVNHRLVVWHSGGYFWKPDEILRDMFEKDEKFNPVMTGVEEDGLHEFIMQPLRHQQVVRQHPLPVRSFKAPKGKDDFIKGLQPFSRAREIVYATSEGCDHAELMRQLEAFPTGRKDVPNALAYALLMRPGAPVYDAFTDDHVGDPYQSPREPLWLAVNTDGAVTSAVLCQVLAGSLCVYADWLREGDPGSVLGDIVAGAGMEAGRALRFVAPARHFSEYDTKGLRAAGRRVPVEFMMGGPEHMGREEIRALLAVAPHGRMGLTVSRDATWTLRGLAGGYCKGVTRQGVVTEEPENNPYRVLMEGLEALAARMRSAALDDRQNLNYAVSPDGRRYLSARA